MANWNTKNMLNVTNDQGNGNENHHEISHLLE